MPPSPQEVSSRPSAPWARPWRAALSRLASKLSVRPVKVFQAEVPGQTQKVRRAAAFLQIPYLLWVSFATALNAAIWRLN